MADSKTSISPGNSPKGGASVVFAKRLQRQLSRGKEKVLQKLGKTVETKDEQFERCVQNLNDQQSDGNKMYKDLKAYIHAVKVMREASKCLSQSLYDAYESHWAGEEYLGAIVEGDDLLWNDYEAKLLDQAMHTMESYMSQFPDVKERVAKRGRKLVDYDSSRHHLEALQNAKKKDDIKIAKATDEMNMAQSVFESINKDLREELPVLYDSRIGCYVSVFQAISNLRDIFYKELSTMNHDLQTAMQDLKDQHPDKVFVVKGFQRTGSLKRRSLMSPKSWKASFSDFHASYSPRSTLRSENRYSFRSSETSSLQPYSPEPQTSSPDSPRPRPTEDLSSEANDLEVSTTSGVHPISAGAPVAELEEEASMSAVSRGAKNSAEEEEEEEEEKPEDEGKETKEEEPELASDEHSEKESPMPIEDSSPEVEADAVQPSLNHAGSTDHKPSAAPEASQPTTEEPTSLTVDPEDSGPGGLENGITPDSLTTDTEGSGSPCKGGSSEDSKEVKESVI